MSGAFVTILENPSKRLIYTPDRTNNRTHLSEMWNLVSSNKLCSDRLTALQHQKHMNNIIHVKPSINNSSPDIPSFLRSRAKQEKIKETRAAVIQYENRVLLDKMMDIERKKTNLNPEVIAKKSFHPTKTLNTNKRVRELRKINDENRAMLRRLQSAHSVYSIDKWIEDDRKNNDLKKMIRQNAKRGVHPDFSATSGKLSKTFYSQRHADQENDLQPGMYFEY